MDRLAHRAALAAACAFLGLAGLVPPTASATDVGYCGILIANGAWCGDGGVNRSYVFNSVGYSGGGAVWVCERLMIADTTTQRENPACSYTYASASFAPFIYQTEAQVSHWTGVNHTIYGLGSF